MSKTLLFDLETDGLLQELTKLHCIVVGEVGVKTTEDVELYHDDLSITPRHGSIKEGLERLKAADTLVAHNGVGFDLPVLEKLYGFSWHPDMVHDTVVWSRLTYSDRRERDFRLKDEGRLEGRYVGRHDLASWGARLGEPKGDYEGSWEVWNQSMADYALRDVLVLSKLYDVLLPRVPECAALEVRFAHMLETASRDGVQLDRKAAVKLLRHLEQRKEELENEIQEIFPPLKVPHKLTKTGKPRMLMCKHRKEKHPDKLVFFDPGSRLQLARRLEREYGWVPKELTAKGNPAMHEQALMDISRVYPVAGKVAEYQIVRSRISVLQDGPSAYFRLADKDDILHGRIIHCGTITGRCASRSPNVQNICSVRKPYGKELRSLFVPHRGDYVMAGFDADGLELRCLANALAPYDGGKYAKAVHAGNKEKGTDVHSMHAAAISEISPVSRDKSKEICYSWLYGGGDRLLGAHVKGGARKGRAVRNALVRKIQGMAYLQEELAEAVRRGHILTPLGMRVSIRAEHAALNSMLQSMGAAVMRVVPLELERHLQDAGVEKGKDYILSLHVHDEVQASLRRGLEETYSACVDKAFKSAERILDFKVPLIGETKYGKSWAETH